MSPSNWIMTESQCWVRLEWTSGDHLVQLPCPSRVGYSRLAIPISREIFVVFVEHQQYPVRINNSGKSLQKLSGARTEHSPLSMKSGTEILDWDLLWSGERCPLPLLPKVSGFK